MPAGDGAGRAVLFDMDGVLVDSTAGHLRAWRAFLDERGAPVPAGGIASLFGRRASEAVAEVLDLAPGSQEADAALMQLETHAERAAHEHEPGGALVAGVVDLVGRLTAAGWRLAVVTSARRRAAEHELGEFAARFATVVTAEDVVRGKPDPQPYLVAAERIGVAARRCVVVEDAVRGVEAARRAQMRVLTVPTTATPDALLDAGAHAVLREVTELGWLLTPGGK